MRRSTDESLRDIERRAKYDPAARIALTAHRLRCGQLTSRQVRVAAVLGDETSQRALGISLTWTKSRVDDDEFWHESVEVLGREEAEDEETALDEVSQWRWLNRAFTHDRIYVPVLAAYTAAVSVSSHVETRTRRQFVQPALRIVRVWLGGSSTEHDVDVLGGLATDMRAMARSTEQWNDFDAIMSAWHASESVLDRKPRLSPEEMDEIRRYERARRDGRKVHAPEVTTRRLSRPERAIACMSSAESAMAVRDAQDDTPITVRQEILRWAVTPGADPG